MKGIILFIIFILVNASDTLAQCAMCKTSVVNNVSNGELTLAEGLNYGIVYLFTAPYVAIATLGYFWYRNSKKKSQIVA